MGAGGRLRPPPPPPRTKWTRRVPHPVLIGHAASLTPAQVDVWSAGVILYMMLTGRTPLHHLFAAEGEVFLGEVADMDLRGAGRIAYASELRTMLELVPASEHRDVLQRMLAPRAPDRPTMLQVRRRPAAPFTVALQATAKYGVRDAACPISTG